jgi:hypothetical protein
METASEGDRLLETTWKTEGQQEYESKKREENGGVGW